MQKSDLTEGRPRLSVAMIVRDAADSLADTLDSIRPIADEIVVVDTGSTDSTLEIAREGADVVREIEWQDHFGAARNECLRHVTGNWILWLDAGEMLDDTAAQQLRTFVDEAAEANKAYLLFIHRPTANAVNCADQIGQLRLMPNGRKLRFTGRVRERVLPSLLDAQMGIDALDCVIQRGEANCDPERQRARARRRLNIANLAITDEGEQAQLLVVRGEALAQLGKSKEAALAYRRAIEVAERGSSEMLESYYGLLTALDDNPTAADTQISICLEALEIYPLDAQLLCGMGSYLLRAQRLDLAARTYEMAVTQGKVDPAIWHLADLADVAATCWSLVLQLLGDKCQAETVLQNALAERPDSLRLRRQLIELYVKTGRERDAVAQCKLLPADMPYRNEMPAVVRGAALAANKKSAAALAPLRGAYQAGCRDPLCLRWLAAAHLAVGNLTDVELVATEWERHEPGNLEIAAFRQAAADQGRIGPQSRRVDGPARPGLPLDIPAPTPRTTPSRI
jgi:tetratricopeptide (TPR) repeat protein